MSNLNTVTNQLLNEYAIKFNENYNDIVQLNSTIQNKEELIIQTQELILYRERNIIILQYFLYFSISILLTSILLATGKIPVKTFLGINVIVFIVLFIACYFHLAKYFSYINISNKLQGLRVAMRNYAQKVKQNIVPPYECPSTCSAIVDEEDGDDNSGDFKYSNSGESLKIDPSLNVWKYGDVPVGDDLDFASSITHEESPQPFFGTSYPQNIYYECQWLGNSTGKNMPKSMRSGTKKYSTIPCTYKPNNTEKSRLFCQKDPNNLSSDEINQYCQTANLEKIEQEIREIARN